MRKTILGYLVIVLALAATGCSENGSEGNGINRQPKPRAPIQQGDGLFPMIQNGKVGYIDRTGKVVIEPKFEPVDHYRPSGNYHDRVWAFGFSEGRAPFHVDETDGAHTYPKIGYIDKAGNVVIQPQFFDAEEFSEGLAVVRVSTYFEPRRYGYIDKSARLVIPAIFEHAYSFSEGLASVAGENCPTGFIDKTGKVVMSPQCDSYSAQFSEGLCVAQDVNGKITEGYMDRSGKVVIPFRFDDCRRFREGRAAVSVKDKWGFIDRSGKVVVKPQFDEVGDFSEGMACVNLGGTQPFSEPSGPLAYGKWGYIGRDGRFVIKPKKGIYRARRFSEGLARICTNGKWGYMDTRGNIAIQPQFDEAGDFSQGLARVGIYERGLASFIVSEPIVETGYIDHSGEYVWKPTR